MIRIPFNYNLCYSVDDKDVQIWNEHGIKEFYKVLRHMSSFIFGLH